MKRLLVLFLSFMTAVSLSGCTSYKTSIAYSVYPIGFLTERLCGSLVESHSVQENMIVQRAKLKPDYRDILENSAVFFHIGQLEPYYSIYSSEINSLVQGQIDLSILNAVYDFQRYTAVEADGEISYIESPYYRGEEFSMIDTDSRDLYLWTDPIAMLSMAKDIRDWLVSKYPDDAPSFQKNFTTLENDLINLDAQYQALASSNEQNHKVIRFVSMTSSFGNWQKTYGFQVYPMILSKYGALPNEVQLQLIEQRIKDDGVKYIVYESNMTEDMIELFNRVEEDLGLTRVELSNLSSLTDLESEAGKDYLSIMYENLSVLETMVEDPAPAAPEEEPAEMSQVHDIQTDREEPVPSALPQPTPTPRT